MRIGKWRIEKAEYVDDLEEIEYRFGCFLCEMTGSRMSKTNYTMEAMVSCANDYWQKICDECRAEREGTETPPTVGVAWNEISLV